MSGGVISYEIVGHTAKELAQRFFQAISNDETTDFSAVSLDDPDPAQKPRQFRARIQAVRAGSPMIFDVDVIDDRHYWVRIEIVDDAPVRFDLVT
jgi:hypothetical protein